MNDADLVLRIVELAPRAIRTGAESVVVLYLWIQLRGSQAGFADGVKRAVEQDHLRVRRDGGFFLRLTTRGFEYLQKTPEVSDALLQLERPSDNSQQQRLVDILADLNRTVPRAVSPAALKQIWDIRRYRADELRPTIDALIDAGHLEMTTTELPGFVLTRAGRQAAGLSAGTDGQRT